MKSVHHQHSTTIGYFYQILDNFQQLNNKTNKIEKQTNSKRFSSIK